MKYTGILLPRGVSILSLIYPRIGYAAASTTYPTIPTNPVLYPPRLTVLSRYHD